MNNPHYIDEEVPWPDFAAEAPSYHPDGTAAEPSDVSDGADSQDDAAASAPPSTPLEVLRHYWGYDAFRGIQRDIIDSILARHDTLGLMPTGGGKSITFQVPGLLMDGTCLVVTPLVALMKDQVAHLRQRGIKATCLHAGLTHEQMLREIDNCVLGHYDFLYLSPERLQTEFFRQKLRHLKVSFITVDEAHCISQWGYDFRPAYLLIRELRHLLPGVPVLALTATATPEVMDDIRQQLEFGADGQTFRMSFDRPNLHYSVVQTEAKVPAIIKLLHATEGSAIVYVRSRSGTRDLALMLQQEGITASYYHAGLSTAEKDTRQQMWQEGRARVMVATNAFGMGIDKSDVRYVLHLDVPDSLEAYFQEAGRAGRDGQPAWAILYNTRSDQGLLLRRIPQEFPPKEKVREIYDDLACFFQLAVGDGMEVRYEFRLEEFCTRFHYFPATVEAALRILQRAGYVLYNADDSTTSRVMFIVRRDDLYDFRHLHPLADRVMQLLLRNYAGLFSDYVSIDEQRLATEAECTPDEVYDTLLGLTRRRLLHYIPRKETPTVTYQQRRVEHDRIVIPPMAYEDRLDQYAARIHSVLRYLNDDSTPRAQQLLDYFGSEPAADTETDDDPSPSGPGPLPSAPDQDATSPQDAVEALLADHELHHPTEFHLLPYPDEEVNDILLNLLDRGQVEVVNGHFRRKR